MIPSTPSIAAPSRPNARIQTGAFSGVGAMIAVTANTPSPTTTPRSTEESA